MLFECSEIMLSSIKSSPSFTIVTEMCQFCSLCH